jgi:hypothetical protein
MPVVCYFLGLIGLVVGGALCMLGLLACFFVENKIKLGLLCIKLLHNLFFVFAGLCLLLIGKTAVQKKVQAIN